MSLAVLSFLLSQSTLSVRRDRNVGHKLIKEGDATDHKYQEREEPQRRIKEGEQSENHSNAEEKQGVTAMGLARESG